MLQTAYRLRLAEAFIAQKLETTHKRARCGIIWQRWDEVVFPDLSKAMRLNSRLLLSLMLTMRLCSTTAVCENSESTLPSIKSCTSALKLIFKEGREKAWKQYEWSRHPTEGQESLPRHWTDNSSPTTYTCLFYLDIVKGHEREFEKFSYLALYTKLSEIILECLVPGDFHSRPQVGYELIGSLHTPPIAQVRLGSKRRNSDSAQGEIMIYNTSAEAQS